MTRGDVTQLDGTWNLVTAMTGLGDTLYVTSEHALYRVDARGYEAIGDDTWDSAHLVGVDGALIAIEPGGGMYRIDPADGTWRQLEGDWSAATHAAGRGDALYVIERSGTLYRVDPTTGGHRELDAGYESTIAFTAAGDTLIALDGEGVIHRVSLEDGSWAALPETWGGAILAAGDGRRCYLASRDTFHDVDPATGVGEPLLDTPWRKVRMAVAGTGLYVLAEPGLMYRIDLAG